MVIANCFWGSRQRDYEKILLKKSYFPFLLHYPYITHIGVTLSGTKGEGFKGLLVAPLIHGQLSTRSGQTALSKLGGFKIKGVKLRAINILIFYATNIA